MIKRSQFWIALSAFGLLAMTFAAVASAAVAKAEIRPTQPGSPLLGEVDLEETPEGLKVQVFLAQAPPGKHGLHFHEKGSCEDSGNAALGHFNPDVVKHGDLLKDGFTGAHAGDLGNIEIDENGSGELEELIPGLTLSEGNYNVVGRAVILHEKADDFGQPTGNAGGRIGCGVIEKK